MDHILTLGAGIAPHTQKCAQPPGPLLAAALQLHRGPAAGLNGLAEPDGPPLAVRDLSGVMRTWIDIGAPDAARMHKAGKAAARVVVYTHKDPEKVRRQWSGERIHRAADLELYSVSRPFLTALVARLRRRMVWALSVTSGHLYATINGEVIEGVVERHALGAD